MKYQEYYLTGRDRCRFFVRQWMPETKPVAVAMLVHGLSDHSGRFEFVANRLAEAGYAFVAPDLRGNGHSDGKRGHFASHGQVMNDLDFLLGKCKLAFPGLPVFLYGQSMGGGLAVSFALHNANEIDAVVASSPWIALSKPPALPVQWLASLLRILFPSLLLPNGLKSKDLCHDAAICHAYDTDPLIHWKVSLSTFFIMKESGVHSIQNSHNLKVPLLLLHSKADPITSFEASSRFAQHGGQIFTFRVYENLFHELHNEPEKEQVLDVITSWLRKAIPC